MPVPPPPPPPPNAVTTPLKSAFRRNVESTKDTASGESQEENCPLGQTETKDITEEEFLAQVCDLVKTRLGEPRSENSSSEEQDARTTLVVAMPLRKAILQNGPMCGIVALAEALHLLNEYLNPIDIMKEAVEKGYTKKGEMFSVAAMESLARACGSCKNSRILQGGNQKETEECLQHIVKHTLSGCPTLIPYDADFNHSPSLRKGHAAHWAVLHGIVIHIPQHSRQLFEAEQSSFQVLKSSPGILIVKPLLQPESLSPLDGISIAKLFNFEDVHVIAHQGKSSRTALWKYKDLIESNQNLKEVAPKILENATDYILFDNIVDGLCSQILLLKK